MIILVGDTRSKEFIEKLKLWGWGRMCVEAVPKPYEGEQWGLDNGAYGYWLKGIEFNENKWLKMIDRILRLSIPNPYFAVLPDIVAGGLKSLEFSLHWLEKTKEIKWDWYLCVQDGMKPKDIPIKLFAGIFLGGTNQFKSTCPIWVEFAKSHNKKFHYGRCGTRNKVHQARRLNCDSIDSNFGLYEKWKLDTYRAWTEQKLPRNIFDVTKETL